MIAEWLIDLGAYAFFLLAPLLVLQVGASFAAVRQGGEGAAASLMQIASRLILPLYALVMLALTLALVFNDFDLLFVAQNTSFSTPLLYKIVGVWGNHEGSLVLWQTVLALFLALMTRRPKDMPARTQAYALGFMGLMILAFYGFSALLAHPFAGNGEVPPGSGDLNVLLQDWAQAAHPPLLYLGYTAAGATFALALAVLVDGQLKSGWADWLRPWALISWTFLTIGIALGSFWAYYELGWGGWWFWDPVENLALMPWLLGTALIHSLQVVRRTGELAGWSLLLALLTFLLVLLGTFIVRSGLLTSVHAFAVDPGRGLYLLVLLSVAAAGSLAAFGLGTRGQLPNPEALAANRQGALLLNNLILMALLAAVAAGTLAPTLIELLGGETYVVGTPFYVPTFVYPALGLVALMALGVWSGWRRQGLAGQALLGGSFIALLALALILGFATELPLRAGLVFALGAWLVSSTLAAWGRQVGRPQNLRSIPIQNHGWALAHLGLAVMLLGMAAATLLPAERRFELTGPMDLEVFGERLILQQRVWLPGENYQSLATAVTLEGRGTRLSETRLYHPSAALLTPATDPSHRDFLADQGSPASEAAIFRGVLSDIFINVQDRVSGAPLLVVARKPGVNWIWAGAILMTLGGVFALAGRRRA